MIVFRTQFPVSEKVELADIFAICRNWVIGSPFSKIKEIPDQLTDCTVSREKEVFQTVAAEQESESSIGISYLHDEEQFSWRSSIVLKKAAGVSWFSFELDCESVNPTYDVPTPKKPYIFKILMNSFVGSLDNEISIDGKAKNLTSRDIDLVAELINGERRFELPIVYISTTRNEKHVVNPSTLAAHLFGVAHVFVEPSNVFSYDLAQKVDWKNAYHGQVGIYWPEGLGSIVLRRQGDHDEFGDEIFHTIRASLLSKRIRHGASWNALLQQKNVAVLEALKSKNSTSVDDFVEAFDTENRLLKGQIDEAEEEIRQLKSEIFRINNLNKNKKTGSLLKPGNEFDVFENEIHDVLVDTLGKQLATITADNRRKHILQSIVDANPTSGRHEELRETLKEILRGYREMSADTERRLKEIGFEIKSEKNHVKLIYNNDERYVFSLPKTGSDNRGGLNLASDIAKDVFL